MVSTNKADLYSGAYTRTNLASVRGSVFDSKRFICAKPRYVSCLKNYQRLSLVFELQKWIIVSTGHNESLSSVIMVNKSEC